MTLGRPLASELAARCSGRRTARFATACSVELRASSSIAPSLCKAGKRHHLKTRTALGKWWADRCLRRAVLSVWHTVAVSCSYLLSAGLFYLFIFLHLTPSHLGINKFSEIGVSQTFLTLSYCSKKHFSMNSVHTC